MLEWVMTVSDILEEVYLIPSGENRSRDAMDRRITPSLQHL
jgi:hypothetical protein